MASYKASEEFNGTETEQIKAYLSTNLTLTGSEQVIEFDIINENYGLTMPSNGIFEVDLNGYYTGHINLYINQTANVTAIIWIECRENDLSPWTLCGGTMIKFLVENDSGSTYPFNSNFNFTAGTQFRIKIKELSGAGSLEEQTETVSLGTLIQPSASITIYRAGNVLL